MPHLKLLFWCASLFSPYFSLSVENPNKMSGVVLICTFLVNIVECKRREVI
nr:MAG TPA: hypothetical protein [Caudoviricetes sp.]